MLKVIVFGALAILLTRTASAVLAAPPPTAPDKSVTDILAGINLGETATWDAAETKLAVLKPSPLPALRTLLSSKWEELDQAQLANDGEKITILRAQVDILDGAILRLVWKSNPRAVVITYLGKVKFADGRTFTREGRPERVYEEPVERAFHGVVFYTVFYPPYRGGAAPSDTLLKQFEVPPPLSSANLFAVDKSGTLQLITDQTTLATFSSTHLNPVKNTDAVKEDTMAWLRLVQTFVGGNTYRFTIPAEKVTAVKTAKGWEGAGVARIIPTPFQKGEITATITFDAQGKWQNVQQGQSLEDLTPPPPMMNPVGPPNGPGAPAQPIVQPIE